MSDMSIHIREDSHRKQCKHEGCETRILDENCSAPHRNEVTFRWPRLTLVSRHQASARTSSMLAVTLSSAPARVVVPRASVKSSSTRDVRIRAHREDKSRRALIASTAALVATGSLSRVARAQEYVDGPDGIQYADLKVGSGPEPFEGDVLKCNYELLVDGKKVDFAKFFVFSGGAGEVIKGWDMVVMGSGDLPPMKVGGVRKALIPPQLPTAPGARDALATGEAGSRLTVLDFTIELVGIKGV